MIKNSGVWVKTFDELNKKFESADTLSVLDYFLNIYKDKIALASSLSIEDQVLTHMILSISNEAKIFTIDTGRLPAETYNLINKTNLQYKIKMDVYFPNNNSVEEMVKTKGINLFYESVEYRKECCNVRKIEPLKSALSGLEAWICGLRSEQSVTRSNMKLIEFDSANNLLKINPLINWTEEMVWDYIKKNNVPYNSLYKKNYKSIGCQPCTRIVTTGADIRSGRWWWENPETKECGLHIQQENKNG